MTLLIFDGTDPNGNYQECRFSGPSLVIELEAVGKLVDKGWTIYRIRLVNLFDMKNSTVLPRELFNRNTPSNPFNQLLREVDSILSVK